ncbi:MAG: GFA family protein, partial [Gammaproteobacteria bacterium]
MQTGQDHVDTTAPSSVVHHGSCLCGAIRVSVRGPLAPLVYCHCAQCRRTAGAPFITVLPVPREAFALEDLHGLLGTYRATPDKARCFCTRCGAPVMSV